MLLWEEYRASHPDGFAYTWFCTTYEAWKGRVRPSMRQTHVAGEKVFVDFAGDTFDIFDPLTGEARPMKLFVATLGASNYTYAEACASESLPDWIGVHANLFAFCQATPTFTSYGDIQSYEVSHDESGPGRRADRKSQSAPPGAADHFVEIGAISSSARLRDRVAGNCVP
jgi:hypothetical protein